MAIWDDIKDIIDQILEFIKLQQMTRIGPYTIDVTTEPQRVLPQGMDSLGKAASFSITLTDAGTMVGTERVLVGERTAILAPLYAIGDTFYEDCPFMRFTDITNLWIKTSAHTATVTVSGVAFPIQFMGGYT